jgi:hypothetical protein
MIPGKQISAVVLFYSTVYQILAVSLLTMLHISYTEYKFRNNCYAYVAHTIGSKLVRIKRNYKRLSQGAMNAQDLEGSVFGLLGALFIAY